MADDLLIAHLLGESSIKFSPFVARALGDPGATLFLCQLLYWQVRAADKDGWVFKRRDIPRDADGNITYNPDDASQQSWEWELGMGRSAQETARKILRKAGLLEEKPGQGMHALMRYRINIPRLHEILLNNQNIADFRHKQGENSPQTRRKSAINAAETRHVIQRLPAETTTTETTSETTTQQPQSPLGPAGGGVDELHENLNPLPPDLQKKAFHQVAHLPTSLQKDVIDELAGQIREGVAKRPQGLLGVLVLSAQAGTLKTDFATRERARRASIAESEARPAESRRQAEREFSVEDITPEFLASLPPGIRKKHEAALARKTGSTTPPADAG